MIISATNKFPFNLGCGIGLAISLACWLAAATPAQAQPRLDLNYAAAWDRLLAESDQLRAAEAGVRGRQAQAEASRKLRQPEVGLDLRQLNYQKSLDFSLGSLAPVLGQIGIPDPLEYQLDGWRTRPVVTLNMPLYTGGRITAAQAAAEAAVRGAESERYGATESLASLLAQAYFGQQLAARALGVRADVLAGLEQHLQRAEALEREGLISRAPRLQAQVARDEAAREHALAQSQLAVAEAVLAGLLRSDATIAPTTPLFVLPQGVEHTAAPPPPGPHPRLQQLDALVDQSRAGIQAEAARLRPTVFAFGQYDFYRDDALFTEPDWIYGIGLRFTLLSNQGRRESLRAAREQAAQVESGLEEARVQLAMLTTRTASGLESARIQFELLESSLALAQENLRLQAISFREGQATSLDVIDAQLGLGRARIQRAQAAHEYVLSLAAWLEATGRASALASLVNHPDRIIVE
ncbi:MAG: TolC family protein [Gammaproteobacteria bacterium]